MLAQQLAELVKMRKRVRGHLIRKRDDKYLIAQTVDCKELIPAIEVAKKKKKIHSTSPHFMSEEDCGKTKLNKSRR